MTLLYSALAVTVLAFTLSGCSEPSAKAEAPRPVRTIVVEATTIGEVITQTGEIRARVETELAFRVAGRVARRVVEIGSSIGVGELLAELDAGDIANEVSISEADLSSAEAAEVAARKNLERQRSLYEKKIVSKAALEVAEAEWRSASSRRSAAQAALDSARNKLSYTELNSPTDGVVTAVYANAGQIVGAGQSILKLAANGERDAVFAVSEKLIAGASPGLPVRVALISDPSVVIHGEIREIGPAADPVTRTYQVRVSLPAAPASMTLGATVTGAVEIDDQKLIAVPSTAITSADGKPAVFVLNAESKALELRQVEVARLTETQAILSTGLTDGEIVVTAGVTKLRPGQVVAYPGEPS